MDSLCQGLNSCRPCCSSECKWVTFDNKTESCHSSVEYLEDVVKMVDKVENCSAPFNPPDEELIKDLSEIFGGMTGGIILALICVICYGYFRLSQEQRQRLGQIAAVGVRMMEFLVRLWHALYRRREDQVPLINDAENQNVRDPAVPQQLPGVQGGAEGQDNLAGNLEDEDDALPNFGLPFALALMDPLPLNEVVIEDEVEDEQNVDEEGGDGENEEGQDEEQEPAGNENADRVQVVRNEAEGNGDPDIQLQQRQQQSPLFVIGAGGQIDSSNDDDDDQLPPPNRSAPRRGPGRNSKSSSVRKLAELCRNRQI